MKQSDWAGLEQTVENVKLDSFLFVITREGKFIEGMRRAAFLHCTVQFLVFAGWLAGLIAQRKGKLSLTSGLKKYKATKSDSGGSETTQFELRNRFW